MTESDLTAIRTLITDHAGPGSPHLPAAFDDLLRALAAQALLVGALSRELRNHRAADHALAHLPSTDALDDLLAPHAEPRRTSYSLSDAEAAARELSRVADADAGARDLTNVLAAIVRIVRVFTL